MKVALETINLIGIALDAPTTNANGQSAIDCGNLWQQFEKEHLFQIPGKLDDSVYAVYHNYESDHTGKFSYFVGCKVAATDDIPNGLTLLTIPNGTFYKKIANGKMPDCVADTWKEIWNSNLSRSYGFDFEIYGEKSKDWNNAEVEIYIS